MAGLDTLNIAGPGRTPCMALAGLEWPVSEASGRQRRGHPRQGAAGMARATEHGTLAARDGADGQEWQDRIAVQGQAPDGRARQWQVAAGAHRRGSGRVGDGWIGRQWPGTAGGLWLGASTNAPARLGTAGMDGQAVPRNGLDGNARGRRARIGASRIRTPSNGAGCSGRIGPARRAKQGHGPYRRGRIGVQAIVSPSAAPEGRAPPVLARIDHQQRIGSLRMGRHGAPS